MHLTIIQVIVLIVINLYKERERNDERTTE
jgi:hypothetical protein